MPRIELAELRDQRVPVFIEFPLHSVQAGESAAIEVWLDGQIVSTLAAPLLTP
jgi:hypothetical protein